jgi:hypothetical protein
MSLPPRGIVWPAGGSLREPVYGLLTVRASPAPFFADSANTSKAVFDSSIASHISIHLTVSALELLLPSSFGSAIRDRFVRGLSVGSHTQSVRGLIKQD